MDGRVYVPGHVLLYSCTVVVRVILTTLELEKPWNRIL